MPRDVMAFLSTVPKCRETYDSEIANLREWLDLASFILSDIVEHPSSEYGRRDLYNDVLACVCSLEQRGLTVLSGVMSAPQDRLPDWKVAVISITPRLTDPGAAKRRHLMVDRRVVALPSGPATRWRRQRLRACSPPDQVSSAHSAAVRKSAKPFCWSAGVRIAFERTKLKMGSFVFLFHSQDNRGLG